MQLNFMSPQIGMVGSLLYVFSKPQVPILDAGGAEELRMIPVAVAMFLNTILQYSLAHGSTPFFRICRALLSPSVAAFSLAMYRKCLPQRAAFALVSPCIGVLLASYYSDTSRKRSSKVLDLRSAFSGIVLSSLYTVWVGVYYAQFGMNRMWQLVAIAPIASTMLLFYTGLFLCISPALGEINIEGCLLVLQVNEP